MSKTKQSQSNVIDLLRHPKYIKKLMNEKLRLIGEPLIIDEIKEDIFPLYELFKHYNYLEKLNKDVHKLNKRVEKKLDKLLTKKDKDDDGSH